MQAGRELDETVAEALGWEKEERDGWWVDSNGYGTCPLFDFKPSTTWEGMGVLIEEARKREIFITVIPTVSGYKTELYAFGTQWAEYGHSAPYAASLLFRKASQFSI